jgi:hypothetical protein
MGYENYGTMGIVNPGKAKLAPVSAVHPPSSCQPWPGIWDARPTTAGAVSV